MIPVTIFNKMTVLDQCKILNDVSFCEIFRKFCQVWVN